MVTRYVAKSLGNDAWDGLSPVWTAGLNGPKASLTAMEATPVTPGDLIHVKGGFADVYRETLTCGVSGTVGNTIEYRGDYAGLIWPGGGVVRITGSDNDRAAARANCITAANKNYRTYTGFQMDGTTGIPISLTTAISNWIIQNCLLLPSSSAAQSIYVNAATQASITVQRCLIKPHVGSTGVAFRHSALVDNVGHIVENCIFFGGGTGISSERVGGITVRNNYFLSQRNQGIQSVYALTPGQTVTVNNCFFHNINVALQAAVLGDLIENYNNIYSCVTARTNVSTGANSLAYPPLLDSRWFFEAVNAGRMVTPFDLSAWSQLINVAGTAPPVTDLRGTGAIGGVREFGPLEFDSTLLIEGGVGGGMLAANKRGNKQ